MGEKLNDLNFVPQIYNENVNDLMNPLNKNLDVRESISGIYINKLSEQSVHDAPEVLSIMTRGDELRNVAETKLNEASSRSHTVFRINIKSKALVPNPKTAQKLKFSQLNLVDLAGSEGASKT